MKRLRQSIRRQLVEAGATIHRAALAQGLLWWGVTCLGVWLTLFALDNLFRLPAGLRFPLALGGVAVVITVFLRQVHSRRTRVQLAERTATALEAEFQIPENLLINACQLETQKLSDAEERFAEKTVIDSGRRIRRIPPSALWHRTRLRKWATGCAVLGVVWLLYCVVLPRQAFNAFARYALPLSDIPPAGTAALQVEPSGPVTVCEGDDLTVRAIMEGGLQPGADATPPVLMWAEGHRPVPPGGSDAAETTEMLHASGSVYTYTFRRVRRGFTFRVLGANTYSRHVRVDVVPLPVLVSSVFRVTPPAYTGRETADVPGPPSMLSALHGSAVEAELCVDTRIRSARWQLGDNLAAFQKDRNRWTLQMVANETGPYVIQVTAPRFGRPIELARGEVRLEADQAPRVEFLVKDPNRFIDPGEDVSLTVQASDDFGIRDVAIMLSRADGAGGVQDLAVDATEEPAATVLKRWTYSGPPGRPGPLQEHWTLTADPKVLVPGMTYLVYAVCRDFSPAGRSGKSHPIVLRVRSWKELALLETDPLAKAFALLREAVDHQRRAHDLTDNLRLHLDEALAGKRLKSHRTAMRHQQDVARNKAVQAAASFGTHEDGAPFASALTHLAGNEMAWVLSDIDRIEDDSASGRLEKVSERQQYILMQLIALLGRIAGDRRDEARRAVEPVDDARPPTVTAEDAGMQLREDLEDFAAAQKRIIKWSRTLLDKGPDDLTDEEEDILGKLAREEAEWAKFLEEKLTDFSKLPLQDFADGSLAEEFNEVFQEVKLAAASLYEKKIELAVPQEQAGLESAEALVNNLERWLPDTPDYQKWLMEEPPVPADIPLAELPSELEDIVGELLDSEEAMTEDVDDVTSSWMDSLDKGAGWDAKDGPISSMSAKGVTGNQLPNQTEIGGRSGEGRTGRSHGQMVEESAVGKEGRDTPTRLTPSPFESGSVEDSARGDPGGATGGGKLSGFAGEGLRGPAPTPRLQQMARLAGQQAQIRQEAENVTTKLKGYNLPTGDMETSIAAMKQFETAAERGDGIGVRRAYSRIIDAMDAAQTSVKTASALHREHSKLPDWTRGEILSGLRAGVPRGYEEMVARYFRAMAEKEEAK